MQLLYGTQRFPARDWVGISRAPESFCRIRRLRPELTQQAYSEHDYRRSHTYQINHDPIQSKTVNPSEEEQKAKRLFDMVEKRILIR